MLAKKINIKITIFLLILILLGSAFPRLSHAQTSAEIAAEIANQQKALKDTESQLNKAKSDLNTYTSSLSSAQSGLPALEAEIAKYEAEINYNNLQLELLQENKELKELEKKQKEIERSLSIKSSYMEWRIEETSNFKDVVDNEFDFKKSQQYGAVILNTQQEDVLGLTGELIQISGEIDEYETLKKDLEQKNEEVKQKKKELEAQIAYYNSMASYTAGSISNLQNSVASLNAKIEILSNEQRLALVREEEILRLHGGGSASSGCQDVVNEGNGKIVFCGNGRDYYQGHGVGMSQFGAKGAADQGWSAENILQFYYSGTTVGQYNLNSEITVKYCQNSPALAAYQQGCNGYKWINGQLVYGYYGPTVSERVSFDQYLSGLGEMPNSWPYEARRAQIIAARTYAARYTNNGDPNYPICLTTYCQVSYFKDGDQSQASAVQSSKDLVITYGGSLIEALYSADNNQGLGTADHDTRFQNFYGNQTGDRPYLRSVNDNQFAANSRGYWYASNACGNTPCGLWGWKTRSYNYQDIDNMLGFAATKAWEVNGIRNTIGQVTSIAFERDASQRIKKVWFSGTTGQNAVMGGWWFKYLWNEWVASQGTYDFIYSQTGYIYPN